MTFLNPFLPLRSACQAFWIALRGHPLTNAREAHQAALKATCRASAEIRYHRDMAKHYDDEARAMDPHRDWHYFASLKDSWDEHVKLADREHKAFTAANARLVATGTRLESLRRTHT